MYSQLMFIMPMSILIFTFPYLTNPLSMGINLLMLIILMTPMMGLTFSHLWISYMLVMILLGGLLVIFIYVSLLAPNETFNFNKKFLMWLMIFVSSMIVSLLTYEPNSTTLNHQNTFNTNYEGNEWLYPLYSNESYLITLILTMYLLLTLIVVVNNTKTSSLPLRSSS